MQNTGTITEVKVHYFRKEAKKRYFMELALIVAFIVAGAVMVKKEMAAQ